MFSFSYLVKFTKVAPQLSMEELNSLSEGMMAALTTCCTLSEEFSCVDDLVSMAHVPDSSFCSLQFLKCHYIIALHSLSN